MQGAECRMVGGSGAFVPRGRLKSNVDCGGRFDLVNRGAMGGRFVDGRGCWAEMRIGNGVVHGPSPYSIIDSLHEFVRNILGPDGRGCKEKDANHRYESLLRPWSGLRAFAAAAAYGGGDVES